MSNGSLFACAVTVQILMICLSSEFVSLAEKADRHFNKGDKLNLGVAALALILATYVYFWLQFGQMMNNLGVNLTLMLLQLGSLYVAAACLRKLHESDDKSTVL